MAQESNPKIYQDLETLSQKLEFNFTLTPMDKTSNSTLTPRQDKTPKIYHDLETLSLKLGFDSTLGYAKWLSSEVCEPYFTEYKNAWLCEGDKRFRKKGGEFDHVMQKIAEGESHGERRYSTDFPSKSRWDGVDHQARLLCLLYHANLLDIEGIFFRKNLSILDAYSRLWLALLRYNLDHSPLRPVDPPSEEATTAEISFDSSSLQQTGQGRGCIRVLWDNIDPSLEENKNFCPFTVVKGVSTMSYEDFICVVTERLRLEEKKLFVSALIFDKDISTFDEAVERASRCQDKPLVKIRTVEQQTTYIPDLDERSHTFNQDFALMLAESPSESLDIRERFWKWSVCRAAGLRGSRLHVESRQLRREAWAVEYQTLFRLREIKKVTGKACKSTQNNTPPVPYDVTEEERASYREVTRWLNNQDYQRDNHLEACQSLGILNPANPRLEGMHVSASLCFWQPVAAAALLKFENGPLSGGILADDVGLGKTFEVLALLQYRINARSNKQDVPAAKPTLLVVPPHLIEQWIDAIELFTSDIIIKVYDCEKRRFARRVEHLGMLWNAHPALSRLSEESAARTVIISTYLTLTRWHGPDVLRNERIRRRREDMPGEGRYQAQKWVKEQFSASTPDRSWPRDLSGRFERVILDEGHEIRNESSAAWIAIRWLNCRYKIIVTATPILNSTEDFVGLVAMLGPDDGFWDRDNIKKLGITDLGKFDPWGLSEAEPTHLLRYTARGLRNYVFNSRLTTGEISLRMRQVLKRCLLRRSYDAMVDGKVIGDELPLVQDISIDMNLSENERKRYEPEYKLAFDNLFRLYKEQVLYDTAEYIRLCLFTSWLGFKWLTQTNLKPLCGGFFDARGILKEIRMVQIESGKMPRNPLPDDIEGLLGAHTDGSPKLRCLLLVIAELVVVKKEKLVIWVMLPSQVIWLEKVLNLLRIPISTHLPADGSAQCDDPLDSIPRSPDLETCQIFICSYLVSPCGLSLPGCWPNIVLFDPPPASTEEQLVGRARSVILGRRIRLIRLFVRASFHDWEHSSLLQTAFPGLVKELKMEDIRGHEVALGDYVIRQGDLMLATDHWARALGPQILRPEVLSPQVLLKEIRRRLFRETNYIDVGELGLGKGFKRRRLLR